MDVIDVLSDQFILRGLPSDLLPGTSLGLM